ncbi:hypothetical protein GCM10011514_15210 [Emticicia aquatilis]|uniref:Uncharacterized protein n=1 Tax=Emticicia aquatilis TaxID=1537369 RepID=A0A916YMR2_9BACT|nr:hypothetical protein [Emticicia aquatilis]GGD51936.1 hypothetical protein GCM10011514_15210 [Emticicia aquatilis]
MDKKHRTLLIIISIVGWTAIGGLGWYFINSYTSKPKKVRGVAEYDTLVQPTHYKTIPSQAFKNVILETDLGPVQIYFEPSEKHSVKFHQSYLKYVDIAYRGDTLVIHAKKTPKSTKEEPVFKQIYVYTPDIKYYQGEASQTTFSYFNIEKLKVDSRSSWMRFYGCKIENLELLTDHPCNYRLEENSYFGKVRADINENSAMTCLSYIQNDLIIKTKDFKKIDISKENVKKLLVEK